MNVSRRTAMLGLGVSLAACATRRHAPAYTGNFRPGMNVRFVGAGGVDNVRDLGLTVVPLINVSGYHYPALPGYGSTVDSSVYRPASDFGMGSDGVIHAMPSGATELAFIVSTRGGEVTWDSLPATANLYFTQHATIASNTITTDGKIRLSSSDGQAPILYFQPDSAALTAGFNSIGHVKQTGDVSTRFLTDQSRADHVASARVSRLMEVTPYLNNIADVATPLTTPWAGQAALGDGKGYLSYAGQAKWCADAGTDLWANIPDQFSDAAVTASANQIAAVTAFTGKVYVAHSNEFVWNTAFTQAFRGIRQGIARGYHAAANKASATPVANVVNTGIDYTTRAIGSAGTTGQILVANMQAGGGVPQGISALQLTANVAAGTVLTVGTNCSLYSDMGAIAEGGRRYHVTRSKEIAELFKAVLGSRVVPVFETWLLYGGAGTAAALAWDSGYLYFKRVAPAGYFGGGNGGGGEVLGEASASYGSDWTASAKAAAIADSSNGYAAARNLIFGGSTGNTAWSDTGPIARSVDNVIAMVAAFASSLEAGFQTQSGYVAGSCLTALYEAGQHIVMHGFSDMANATAAGKAIQNDARMGTAFGRLVAGFAPSVAEMMFYADVQDYTLTADSLYGQGWGIRSQQGVATSRSAGLEAAVAGYLT